MNDNKNYLRRAAICGLAWIASLVVIAPLVFEFRNTAQIAIGSWHASGAAAQFALYLLAAVPTVSFALALHAGYRYWQSRGSARRVA